LVFTSINFLAIVFSFQIFVNQGFAANARVTTTMDIAGVYRRQGVIPIFITRSRLSFHAPLRQEFVRAFY
jgi:hypothetical protein